jgi:hypothetical protein
MKTMLLLFGLAVLVAGISMVRALEDLLVE